MAYNRFRRKEKNRRQYTLTKTKAFVGFILSAIFSITLSAYFERYGESFLHTVNDVFTKSARAAVSQIRERKAIKANTNQTIP